MQSHFWLVLGRSPVHISARTPTTLKLRVLFRSPSEDRFLPHYQPIIRRSHSQLHSTVPCQRRGNWPSYKITVMVTTSLNLFQTEIAGIKISSEIPNATTCHIIQMYACKELTHEESFSFWRQWPLRRPRNLSHLTLIQGLLPCSRQPITGPCSQPD